MRVDCCRKLRTRGMVAGCCMVGMMLVNSPLLGQGNETNPAGQALSAETNVGLPTAPKDPILSPEETPAKPPEPFTVRGKILKALLKENFSYNQSNMVDPFVSFIAPAGGAPPELLASEEEFEPPPEPQRPLTPLQKMNLGEIEKGLKAIAWGELGRRALVEDSAGKGYIVTVGTPAGERNGVITDIFNDRIVIQQQLWDQRPSGCCRRISW